MARIVRFENFEEFIESDKPLFQNNYLLYYYAIVLLYEAYQRGQQPEAFFNIVDGDERLFAVKERELCLVYATACTDGMLNLLDEPFDYFQQKRWDMSGTANIIQSLIDRHSLSYKLVRHRVIYKCEKGALIKDIKSSEKLELANMAQLDTLSRMGVEFSKDYYGKAATLTELKNSISKSIEQDSMFVWKENYKIRGMVNIMLEGDQLVIGLFYVEPAFRKKGLGKLIIEALLNILLFEDDNNEVWLSTDAKSPAPNAVFRKCGFVSTGEFMRVECF